MNTYLILKAEKDIWNLPFQIVENEIPDIEAVYVLVNRITKNIDYVGRTSNLRKRLMHKSHPVYVPNLYIIKFFPTSDQSFRWYLEYRLISILKPSLNKRAGFCPKAALDVDNLDANYRAIFG